MVSGCATSCRSHSSVNLGEASRNRRTRHFQAGSATCSAIAPRSWATIRAPASSRSTKHRLVVVFVNISQRMLRSSTGSASRSPTSTRYARL